MTSSIAEDQKGRDFGKGLVAGGLIVGFSV